MICLDKHDLQVIVLLRRNPDFVKFIEILNKAAHAVAIGNAQIKDEVISRWNQGRLQELLDILKIIKNADEDMQGLRTEARRHVE